MTSYLIYPLSIEKILVSRYLDHFIHVNTFVILTFQYRIKVVGDSSREYGEGLLG